MKKFQKLWAIVPLLFCFVMISAYFNEQSMREENKEAEYAFVIKGLHQNAAKRLYIHNGEEEILFMRPFFLSERDSLKLGDSIYKGKGADYLFIYRKNSNGDYQLYHRTKSELKPYNPKEINPYFNIK